MDTHEDKVRTGQVVLWRIRLKKNKRKHLDINSATLWKQTRSRSSDLAQADCTVNGSECRKEYQWMV